MWRKGVRCRVVRYATSEATGRGYASRSCVLRRQGGGDGVDKVRVGLVQLHCDHKSVTKIQDKAERLVMEAADKGAKFVLLPELYCAMGKGMALEALQQADDIHSRWKHISKSKGIWILDGSRPEQAIADKNKIFNTSTLYSEEGKAVAKYRKIHLFDIDVPGDVTFKESSFVEAGDQTVVAESPFGNIGLAICYDLRFPEMFAQLAQKGIDIICCPSAFTKQTGKHHWKTLVRCRAIESQCFVIAPNQVNQAPNKFHSFGHSLVVDPWGEIKIEGSENREEVLVTDLELPRITTSRTSLPSVLHHRWDLFGSVPNL